MVICASSSYIFDEKGFVRIPHASGRCVRDTRSLPQAPVSYPLPHRLLISPPALLSPASHFITTSPFHASHARAACAGWGGLPLANATRKRALQTGSIFYASLSPLHILLTSMFLYGRCIDWSASDIYWPGLALVLGVRVNKSLH